MSLERKEGRLADASSDPGCTHLSPAFFIFHHHSFYFNRTSFTSPSRSTGKEKDSKRSDPAFVVMEFDLSQLRVITFRPHYITFLTTQASSRVHFFMGSCENNLLHRGICHIEVVKHTFICLYGYLSMLIYVYLHVYMDAPVEELRNESCWPHARTRAQDFELTLVEKIRLWSDI